MTLTLIVPRRRAEELHALADSMIRRGIEVARSEPVIASALIGAGIRMGALACRIDEQDWPEPAEPIDLLEPTA